MLCVCVCVWLHSSGLVWKTPSNEREWNESDVAGPVDPDSSVKSFSISLILRLAKLQSKVCAKQREQSSPVYHSITYCISALAVKEFVQL